MSSMSATLYACVNREKHEQIKRYIKNRLCYTSLFVTLTHTPKQVTFSIKVLTAKRLTHSNNSYNVELRNKSSSIDIETG